MRTPVRPVIDGTAMEMTQFNISRVPELGSAKNYSPVFHPTSKFSGYRSQSAGMNC